MLAAHMSSSVTWIAISATISARMSELNSENSLNALGCKITILPNGLRKTVTFHSINEAKEWVGQEMTAWGVLYNKVRNTSSIEQRIQHPITNLYDALMRAQRTLSRLEEKYRESPSDEVVQTAIGTLRGFESPPFLSSQSVFGKYVLELEDGQVATALVVLGVFQGARLVDAFRHTGLDATVLLHALSFYTLADAGGIAELSTRRKSFGKAMDRWEGELTQLATRARAFLTHAENETNDALDRRSAAGNALTELHAERSKVLSDLAEEHRQSLTELTEQRRKELDELFNERTEALTKLEATYREHLRLKAPADYWKEKATRHRANARRWLVTVAALAFGGIGGAGALYWQLLTWLDGLKSASVATASLVLLALPALLYATLVRMAHRSYRDEVRHTDDAEQRTTLVQTYLALTHENSEAIQPGERLLALHALFRGSAQSDSPDDTPPVNALEALLQGLKPKTGS